MGVSINQGFVELDYDWAGFKSFLDGSCKALSPQFKDEVDLYDIFAIDSQLMYRTLIYKLDSEPAGWDQARIDLETANRDEWEASYKPTANMTMSNNVSLHKVPMTSDGRLIISPAVFSGNQNLNFPGRGDDLSLGTRGTGPRFLVDSAADPDPRDGDDNIVMEWQYLDSIYVDGGECFFANGGKNDCVTMDIVAPATESTPNGASEGNVNKVMTPFGFSLFVPAPLGDGDTDIDYDVALHPAVDAKPIGYPTKITKAVPVPSIAKVSGQDVPDGFWNYDSTTGVITPAMGPAGEKLGFFNLYDIELILVRWVTDVSIWNFGSSTPLSIEYSVPVKAKKVFPHWVFRSSWHFEGVAPTGAAHWYLYTAREFTS